MRWLRTIPLVALVGGSLLEAERYIADNPRLSARWVHMEWREAPLLAVLMLAAALCLVQPSLARNDAPSQRSAMRHALLSLALMTWIGGVAAASMTVVGESSFFWGAIAPYLLAALVFVVVRTLRPSVGELAWVITGASLVVTATVMLDAAGRWHDGPLESLRRPHGLLFNRNYAGEYLALTLAFALPALARPRARWLLVPIAFALVWTRCRTAWIAAPLTGVCLLLCSPHAQRRALATALATLCLAMLLAAVVPTRLQWREHDPYRATAARLVDLRSGSGALRVRQYRETLELVRGRLLVGLGPGRWQENIARRDATLAINRNPHSDYLRALADGGLPSVAGLCLLLAFAGAAARRVDPRATTLVVVFSFMACADCPLYRIETFTLAAAVLGTVAAALAPAGVRSPSRTPAPAVALIAD